MRILITGVNGFAGPHIAAYMLEQGHDVVGVRRTLEHRDRIPHGVEIVTHDLSEPITEDVAARFGPIDLVVSLASSTDIAGSIEEPFRIFDDNLRIVATLSEWALGRVDSFVHISTEEIYGPAVTPHREWDPFRPSTPYSASKLAQEAYLIAQWRQGLPLVILNSMNLIGPGQADTKLVPTIIRKTLAGDTVPLIMAWYEEMSGQGEESTRQYMHPRVLASAILHTAMDADRWYAPNILPPRYNVAGDEIGNVALATKIAGLLDLPLHWKPVPATGGRPGHEPRFALDDSKLRSTGWVPPINLDETITETVAWYLEHPEWL